MADKPAKENKYDGETAEATEEHYSMLVPEEEDESEVWGRMMPLSNSFKRCNLIAEEISFGKDEECDYVFLNPIDGLPKDRFLSLYSKRHFRIRKENDLVYVYDDSANGTFLQGQKIGKGKRAVISSGTKIAIGVPNNAVFLFMDNATDNSGVPLPAEFAQKFMLSSVLGRGACGEVRLCFAKCSDKKFAVKIVEKHTFESRDSPTEFNMREVQILGKIDHPNIVRIFDVYETDQKVFILLEYVDSGDLFNWITGGLKTWKGADRCAKVKPVFAQMVLAVKYLHDQGITHRDLKPENIMLASDATNYIVKITDFGMSKMLTEQSLLKTFCGTPTYLAPEILLSMGLGTYTKAVDCWSLGVILFLLLAGYPPFSQDYVDLSLADQIKTGRYRIFESEWKDVDPEARDIVVRLLKVSPGERLTIDDVAAHPWLQDEDMKSKLNSLIPNLVWPSSDHVCPARPSRKRNHLSDEDAATSSPKRVRKSI